MKLVPVVVAVFVLISVIGYFGWGAINEHIDRESGAIVENVLSDNTISQLRLLSEVQSLLKSGDIAQAETKISEYTKTFVYILKNDCSLPKCEEALRIYEQK